jgi:8-oxo-dGTP pyrophosphatase MutT (NUDIX family)
MVMDASLPQDQDQDRDQDAPRRQCAALACLVVGDGIRVMLVTSRGTGRWVLPKGWLKLELGFAQTAAEEAYEEAGLRGNVEPQPVGQYRYTKQLADGGQVDCIVDVFPLCVAEVLDDWPERTQRQRRWCSFTEAAELVEEADLTALLLRMALPGGSLC